MEVTINNGQWTKLVHKTGATYAKGTKFKLVLEVTAEYVRVLVEDREVLRAAKVPIVQGKIGVISLRNNRITFSNFSVSPLP